MTRLFYTILYSAIAALAIAQWKRHDSGELLDLVGARRANAQSPDPTLPGSFDPAANGGMNNRNGFNNMNPANPATQLMNSNAKRLGIDTHHMAVAGHSMGGWVVVHAASRDHALIGAIIISAADVGKQGKFASRSSCCIDGRHCAAPHRRDAR